MSIMQDLADAISAVLDNRQAYWKISNRTNQTGLIKCSQQDLIEKKHLDNLEKQYNIYFIEPESEWQAIIDRATDEPEDDLQPPNPIG